MTFTQALYKAGFKKMAKYRNDITSFCNGTDPGNSRYAEIINYEGWSEVWIVGKDIRHIGTLSYPGGRTFQNAKELNEYLQSLPKLQTPTP